MSLVKSIVVYKIIKALTTPWTKTAAYKQGLVDEKGTMIKKPVTKVEKDAYTLFDRFLFNIKRLLLKIPFVGTKLSSYMFASLFLLKDHCELSNDEMKLLIEELGMEIDKPLIKEGSEPIIGQYVLTEDIASPKTGEVIAQEGTKIQFENENPVIDNVLGVPIYEARHIPTNQTIFVSHFSFK